MKIFAPIAGIFFGLALLTVLTAYYGFASVIQAVVSSQWGALIVVAARAIALAAAGIAWWSLLTPIPRGPYIFVSLRFIREAINSLFPLAVVGGDVIGARLLAQFDIVAGTAIASVLIDIFIQAVCLLVFVLAGLGILLNLTDTHQLAARTLVILAIGLPAVAGFCLVLNFGAFEPIVRWLTAFGERRQWTALSHVADLGSRLQKIWQNRRDSPPRFLFILWGYFLERRKSGLRSRSWGMRLACPKQWQLKALDREVVPPLSSCPADWACRTEP